MRCERWLEALTEDTLTPGLADHVTGCADCSAELSAFRETERLLFDTRDEPADFELTGFVHRTVDAAVKRRDRSLRGLWWRMGRLPRRALTAGVLLFAASFALLFVPAETENPAPAIAATASAPAADYHDEFYEYLLTGEDPLVDELLELAARTEEIPLDLDTGFHSLSVDEMEAFFRLLEGDAG